MRSSERFFNHGLLFVTIGATIYPEVRVPALMAMSMGVPLIAEYSSELTVQAIFRGVEIGSKRIKAVASKKSR